MKIRAEVHIEATHLIVSSAATNDDSATAYLLHLEFYGSSLPTLNVLDGETAQLSFGRIPRDPANTGGGCGAWPSRSAGDPVAPGATLRLETRLPLPLAEHNVLRPFGGPNRGGPIFEETVSRLLLVFPYAVPPPSWRPPARPGLRGVWDRLSQPGRRPTPAPNGGFDVYGTETRVVTTPITLPRPLTVWRSVSSLGRVLLRRLVDGSLIPSRSDDPGRSAG